MTGIIFIVIEVVLFLLFLSVFYKYKNSKFSILYVVVMIFTLHLTNKIMMVPVNLVIDYLIYAIIAVVLFEGPILNKLFLSSMFLVLTILSDFLTKHIILDVWDVSLSLFLSNKRYFLYSSILNKLFEFVFLVLINFIKNRNHASIHNENKFALSLAIFPISCLFIIFGIIDLLDHVTRLSILIYIGLCGLVISTIYVYYLFHKVLWSDIKNQELKHLKEVNKLNSQYFKLQEDNYNMKKAIIHDIKKHIDYIAFAVKNKEFDMLEEYMIELKANTFIIDKNHTGNKVLDIVVNSKIEEIQLNQIRLKFDIDKTIQFSKMELVDQNILFSNLFDNCIENTCKTDIKFISIKLRKIQNDFILLKFMNTFKSELIIEDYTKLKSKKNDEENHGIGTKIILGVVEKYKGELHFEVDEVNSLFIISIIFEKEYVG